MAILVVYDGDCGVCTWCVGWIRRLDWIGRFDCRPNHDAEVFRIAPDLTPAACAEAAQAAWPDGRRRQGGAAMRAILLRLPLTALPGAILCLPPLSWAFDALYPVFARNRYRFGGTCRRPT